MNILYISNLSGNMWAGPNNSVPAQILAQSKVDNVFWYNINHNSKKEWEQSNIFYNLDSYPEKKISKLPSPFSNPDLVVFEGIYEYPFSKLAFEVQKRKIPYILIPRSQLTKKAQDHKKIKKNIGNRIFFSKFIWNATAIQYLTVEEYNESGNDWNDNHLIIPNGIRKKELKEKTFKDKRLKGIYIGRVEIYQKGLDLLIEACAMIQDEMRSNNCTIDLYGPDMGGAKERLMKMISDAHIDDLIKVNKSVFDEEKEKIQIKADFFIMTSRFEGHPMGLIEALSYGLPTVSTTGTNMTEEIDSYNAGWTSDINVESIKTSILTMMLEKKEIKRKSQNAVRLSKIYDWEKIALLSQREYTNLLSEES